MTPLPTSRWEHGSDYHAIALAGASGDHPWGGGGRMLGSGRDALRALVELGVRERGWRRLWLPTYYCPEVVHSLEGAIDVSCYPGPILDAGSLIWDDLRDGDVVLDCNLFGLRGPRARLLSTPRAVELVEDHTHDPWSPWARSSQADWCIASLRKTLPVPDGGVLWSPRGHALPAVPALDPEHARVSLERFGAMVLKAIYLASGAIPKETFRAMMLDTEARISAGAVSSISAWSELLLANFATAEWRRLRRRNFDEMVAALDSLPRIGVLEPEPGAQVPYAVVLRFDEPEERDRLRSALIAQCVYPAILWPLDPRTGECAGVEEHAMSRRLLAVHCDGRYSTDDMHRVAAIIRRSLLPT